MADGCKFEVNHLDFIARSPRGWSVWVDDSVGVDDLNVRLIAELCQSEASTRDDRK
jgi:hypothetical protein